MDSIDSEKNFFKYVFKFDEDTKSDLLNIVQFSILALIPIISLNKAMNRYVPEADDHKSSIELVAEIILQMLAIFLGLFLVNRIVTFVPTYSGKDYPETYGVHFNILAILLITLSLQTKLGEKVNILLERLNDLWNGTDDKNKKNKGKGNVKVTQPIAGQMVNTSQTYNDGTSISDLPPSNMPVQQLPDYNTMHRTDTTPLVNATTPGMTMESFEPMAANSVLGGGSFGSW